MSNETLIRCCAPTMACLKTGNMFNCAFESREHKRVLTGNSPLPTPVLNLSTSIR